MGGKMKGKAQKASVQMPRGVCSIGQEGERFSWNRTGIPVRSSVECGQTAKPELKPLQQPL